MRSEEQAMHNTLFAARDEIEVKTTNHATFSKANSNLKDSIMKQWKLTDFYQNNWGKLALGSLLLNIVFVLHILLADSDGVIFLTFCSSLPFIALEFQALFYRKDQKMLGCVWGIIAAVMFAAVMNILFENSDPDGIDKSSFFFFSALSIIYALFAHRMRRLTPDGAKLLAEIEGLKMYMQTAEERRLNMLNPPERTPELFEKLLPYSIALGVNNEWCKKFGDVLKKFNYNPTWCDNKDFATGVISAAAFATTFAAISNQLSNSTYSGESSSGSGSWSSGSSGGGYSGGGGGGGGVRGR